MKIPHLLLLASISLAGSPVNSAGTEDQPVRVQLTSFRFEPSTVALVHGQRYVLELTNGSGGGHNFDSPEFFQAASIAPEDAHLVRAGRVAVGAGQTASIHLAAPAAGHYKVKCTHFMHSALGMKGEIVVS